MVLLCVRILHLPATNTSCRRRSPARTPTGAPANALWLTNICVQALLLWTLANSSTYTNLVYLATSLILLPLHVGSAACRCCWRCAVGPTSPGHGRLGDLIIGVIALGYAVWLVYAGGWQYLLVAALFYLAAPGSTCGPARKVDCLRCKPEWAVVAVVVFNVDRGRRADGHRKPGRPVSAADSRLGVWSSGQAARGDGLRARPGHRRHPENTKASCSTTSSGCNRRAATTSTSSPKWWTAASSPRTPGSARRRGGDSGCPPVVLDRTVTDNLVGPGLTHEIRAWLTELAPDRLAEFLVGGLACRTWSTRWTADSCICAAQLLDPAGSSSVRFRTRSSCATTPPGSSPASLNRCTGRRGAGETPAHRRSTEFRC